MNFTLEDAKECYTKLHQNCGSDDGSGCSCINCVDGKCKDNIDLFANPQALSERVIHKPEDENGDFHWGKVFRLSIGHIYIDVLSFHRRS